MARFLVTGSRAPVALELVRNLAKFGHTVFLADSLRFPLGRHSNFVTKSFYVTAPRKSLQGFKMAIEEILVRNKVDILIPTCEEVFYISAIKDGIEKHAKIFCPDFAAIKLLHSKSDIYSCAVDTGFLAPQFEVVKFKELKLQENYQGKVVKKEFCRFGTDVLIEPDKEILKKKFNAESGDRFIVQELIEGSEYCSYAISNNGKVSFVSIYEPIYRVGKAAGIYFNPVIDANIEQFIINFCKKNRITGQISFDVIKNDKGIYLIECNPRATSGLHLLSEMDLSRGFLTECKYSSLSNQAIKPKMVTLAMLLIGLPLAVINLKFNEWKKDFKSAEDVISIETDKSFHVYSLLSFAEIIAISLQTMKSLRSASTYDIEWDGEELNA